MTLRVGIVGAAWGGFAHLPAWRAIPGVEVTAICTSRQETADAAAARLGLPRAFGSAAAMCADPAIDIVDCGTRPAIREPIVMAALANGKHVYNSFPHAPDWPAARAIDRAWRAAGVVGVVDAFSEWLPAHRQMKAMLDAGHIGTPLSGICRFSLSLFNRPDRRFPYNWFAEAGQGVSAVRNLGGHMLHMLRRLFGPIAEVVADDRRMLDRWVFDDGTAIAAATNDVADVILRFAGGLTMTMQVSWNQPVPAGWLIDVHGSDGRLIAEAPSFPTPRDCTLAGGRIGEAAAPIAVADAYRTVPGIGVDWLAEVQPSFPMALAMHAMVEAIGGRGNAVPDFAEALEVERAQEAIRVSARERRWVSLAEIV